MEGNLGNSFFGGGYYVVKELKVVKAITISSRLRYLRFNFNKTKKQVLKGKQK